MDNENQEGYENGSGKHKNMENNDPEAEIISELPKEKREYTRGRRNQQKIFENAP